MHVLCLHYIYHKKNVVLSELNHIYELKYHIIITASIYANKKYQIPWTSALIVNLLFGTTEYSQIFTFSKQSFNESLDFCNRS